MFNGIIAGNYTLTENTVAEGYTGVKIEFKFKIENDGSVIYMTNTPLISE
ncbi:SpaA isopeptide-forming pilin-related protein [Enterococcus raffinosus]